MALFRCEIHKSFNGKKFANDYLFEATDIGNASALAQDWASVERAIMPTTVSFLDIRTSTAVKGDRIFNHFPLNLTGQLNFTPDITLPAFCCLRLDFTTTNSDPGHKYYRYVIPEPNQGAGTLDPSWAAGLLTNIQGHLTSNPDMLANLRVGKLGHAATGVSIYPFVQMRQEHRRRKKKAVAGGTPV
jgi:hypothetical protein